MNNFLGLESKFYKVGTWLGDMAVLMLLWFLCSVPVFTLGASTTAVYYVTTRQISGREGYMSKDFFKSFLTNFLQATIATVIMLVLLVITYINISATPRNSVFFPLQFLILYEILATFLFLFPLLSRFDMKMIKLLQMSFTMANRHMLTSVSAVLLFCIGIFLIYIVEAPIYIYPIFLMIFMAVYTPITSLMYMNIFRKYQPDIDKDEDEM
ncbi:MAG: YesL family protein [Firmicutes bacterium]|nr:YesL family protein [Bacillota bacterium]